MIRSIRDLTPQQRKIAVLIGEGLSYAEIGVKLEISPHTVRAHVRAMGNLIDDDGAFPPRTRVLVFIKEQTLALAIAKRSEPIADSG